MGLFDIFKGKGNKNIVSFPEIEDVFAEDLDECRKVFFPVYSIRLGDVNPEWGDEKIHVVQFNEDPYNTETAKYFTDYCKDCMISFKLKDGKYVFSTDFRYFDLTDDWKEWFQKTKETYTASKRLHKSGEKDFFFEGLAVGGEPEWWQDDETPIDPSGNPMHFITEFETDDICDDYCDKKIFLFYSPEHKLAVQLYQNT